MIIIQNGMIKHAAISMKKYFLQIRNMQNIAIQILLVMTLNKMDYNFWMISSSVMHTASY